MLLGGCPQRNAVETAIARRGGACPAVTRASTVDLRVGYPGRWLSRATSAGPERYAWTYDTTGAPFGYLFDGQVVRSFVGAGQVTEDSSPTAPLRSHARFTAVMLLAALQGAGTVVEPTGVAFADAPEPYRLTFDAAGLLARVDGPLEFPGLPPAIVTAALSDYRAEAGLLLPHRIRYTSADQELADEQVTDYCIYPQGLPDTAFRAVSGLPSCP